MTLTVTVTQDLGACHTLRRRVFIDEQGISEAEEFDDLDGDGTHMLALVNSAPVGTARTLVDGDCVRIGRVCVLSDYRGRGVGAALIRAAMDEARARGLRTARLSAQLSAMGFYGTLGFLPEGEVYLDADIPHRMMAAPL